MHNLNGVIKNKPEELRKSKWRLWWGDLSKKIIAIKTSVTEQNRAKLKFCLITPNLVLNICIFVEGPTIFELASAYAMLQDISKSSGQKFNFQNCLKSTLNCVNIALEGVFMILKTKEGCHRPPDWSKQVSQLCQRSYLFVWANQEA